MIPTLIFLLTIILLGTAIYLHFRQVQKRSFPIDKYYEALDYGYKKKLPKGENSAKFMITSLLVFNFNNFLILSGTIIIAFLICIVLVTSGAEKMTLLIFSPFIPLLIVIFPEGLINIVQTITDSKFANGVEFGWLIYFTVIMLGSFAKDRFIFISVYIVLIILLILNIAGFTRGL
jgi:hypothetical protein